jgi:hypothetical protein
LEESESEHIYSLSFIDYTTDDVPPESTCRGYFIGEETSDENQTEEHHSRYNLK